LTDQADPGSTAASTQFETFRIIEERLQQAVQREEETDYQSSRANRRTQSIGRLSLLVVVLLTPPVFYLIWTLVVAMGVITDRMGAMHAEVGAMETRFDEVAVRMKRINGAVASMSQNIAVIPPMEERLLGMRQDMGRISGSMDGIAPNVHGVDQVLGGMDQNLLQMNHAFGILTRDVFRMRKNVNQMSSPMRMIPFLGQ
jgi:archaellum component FlaC